MACPPSPATSVEEVERTCPGWGGAGGEYEVGYGVRGRGGVRGRYGVGMG